MVRPFGKIGTEGALSRFASQQIHSDSVLVCIRYNLYQLLWKGNNNNWCLFLIGLVQQELEKKTMTVFGLEGTTRRPSKYKGSYRCSRYGEN